MITGLSAVVEDFRVMATGFFEGIDQLRHTVEGSAHVDDTGQIHHAGGHPSRIGGDRPEGVAKDVTKKCSLKQQ
jgi:hypothetical protein